jgi:molybdopterin synthase sulfur carrier subunit
MLKLCYFASVREQVGTGEESLLLPDEIKTVGALGSLLATRGQEWEILADEKSVLIAVDQQICPREHILQGGEEIAFFPPMTGG